MVATANVKTYPDAYRKLKRIAKQRRWTLAVAVDEAVKALERQHRQTPEESTVTASDEMTPPASGSDTRDAAPASAMPHSPSPHPGTAVSPDAAVSCIDPAASQGSASGHEPGKVAGQVSTTRVRPVQGQDAAAVQQERSTASRERDSG